jgi:hypothetical protein
MTIDSTLRELGVTRISDIVGPAKNQGIYFGIDNSNNKCTPIAHIHVGSERLVEIVLYKVADDFFKANIGNQVVKVYDGCQTLEVAEGKKVVVQQTYSRV